MVIHSQAVTDLIPHIKTLQLIQEEDRIEFLTRPLVEENTPEQMSEHFEYIFGKILDGTHVFLDDWGNMMGYHNFLTKDVKCAYGIDSFESSTEKLLTGPAGWGMRKNFSLAEEVNLEMMRLNDVGITIYNVRKNDGIFSPEVMDKACQNRVIDDFDMYVKKEGMRCKSTSSKLESLKLEHIFRSGNYF